MCEETGIPRGSTPTNTFTTDTDLRGLEVLYITYHQDGKNLVEKTINDIEIEEEYIETTLSQEETLRFSERGGNVLIQIRGRFPDGSAPISNIIVTTVERVLKDGVI